MIKRGYTLIELLVTVSIIAILSVVAYPALNKVSDRENLITAKNELRNCYLEARAYAMAPRVSGVDHYQASYDDTGCRVLEYITAGSPTVISEFKFSGSDYEFIGNNGVHDLKIDISTDPPFVISISNSMGPISGYTILVEVKNSSLNAVGAFFVQTPTGVIISDV